MITIEESENYIQILEENADRETKHKLLNIYPESENAIFNFILVDFEIRIYYDEMRELLTDIIPFSSCDIEADDLEKEYENLIKKIDNIATDKLHEVVDVRILLKKIR